MIAAAFDANAIAEESGWTVTSISGDVQLWSDWNVGAAAEGMKVGVGDRLFTGLGARAVCSNSGGTITLGELTEIEPKKSAVIENRHVDKIQLKHGTIDLETAGYPVEISSTLCSSTLVRGKASHKTVFLNNPTPTPKDDKAAWNKTTTDELGALREHSIEVDEGEVLVAPSDRDLSPRIVAAGESATVFGTRIYPAQGRSGDLNAFIASVPETIPSPSDVSQTDVAQETGQSSDTESPDTSSPLDTDAPAQIAATLPGDYDSDQRLTARDAQIAFEILGGNRDNEPEKILQEAAGMIPSAPSP